MSKNGEVSNVKKNKLFGLNILWLCPWGTSNPALIGGVYVPDMK